MPYGPTSSPLPLNAPQLQSPGQYTGVPNAQRDAIAQALLNIQNPPPRTDVPQGVMNAPAAPSPTEAPGAPPMPGAPIAPGAGAQPGGLMPGGMNQTMQPGAMVPGGLGFAPPPQVGVQPQQSPMLPPQQSQQQPPY